VRPDIERAMKETGSRELRVVMPRVRQWLSKEQTNMAAKILLHNIYSPKTA
jgi:tRNA C32,U32 (ribose-2'-O)-methylase TrmJ